MAAVVDSQAERAALEGLAHGVRNHCSAAGRLATLRREAEPLPTVVREAPLGSGGLTTCSVLALGDVELSRVAFTDPGTDLANRRALERDLEAAVSRADRNGCSVAVLYVDLDRFKAVNDEFGHHAGDLVLREVARRRRWRSRSTSKPRSRIRSTTGSAPSTRASAWRCIPTTPRAPRSCSSPPTRRCTGASEWGGREEARPGAPR